MRNFKTIILFITILFITVLITSCGEDQKTELMPKDGADEEIVLEQTETVTVDSVTVEVSADAWTGDPAIRKNVTPLKLTIENNSSDAVKITYENISLVTEDGDVYSALPIYKVRGEGAEAELAEEYEIIVKTEFEHRNFDIYPMYTRVYTDIPVTEHKYSEDPLYYEEYYAVWNESGLPTPDMKLLALPEGILSEGGMLSGFVYFEKVDPELKEISLNMKIINPENNAVKGEVEIPFWVFYEAETEYE